MSTPAPRSFADLTARAESSGRARAVIAYAKNLCLHGRQDAAINALAADGIAQTHIDMMRKAAVELMSTGGVGSGAELAANRLATADALALVARRSVPGQLRELRRAPANVAIPVVSAGSSAAWQGETTPIPASALALDTNVSLPPTGVNTILVFSKDLLRFGGDAALSLFESDLIRAIVKLENSTFLSADAAVAQQKPAGLLAGLSPTGDGSPDSIEDDVADLFRATRGGINGAPYFVCSADGALFLATARGTDGARIFPNVGVRGGDIFGVPVIVAPEAADKLICLDASAIAYTDLGIEFSQATSVSVQMDDAPTDAPTNQVSLFQIGSVGLKATRFLHWAKGTDDCVQYLDLPVAGSPA